MNASGGPDDRTPQSWGLMCSGKSDPLPQAHRHTFDLGDGSESYVLIIFNELNSMYYPSGHVEIISTKIHWGRRIPDLRVQRGVPQETLEFSAHDLTSAIGRSQNNYPIA